MKTNRTISTLFTAILFFAALVFTGCNDLHKQCQADLRKSEAEVQQKNDTIQQLKGIISNIPSKQSIIEAYIEEQAKEQVRLEDSAQYNPASFGLTKDNFALIWDNIGAEEISDFNPEGAKQFGGTNNTFMDIVNDIVLYTGGGSGHQLAIQLESADTLNALYQQLKPRLETALGKSMLKPIVKWWANELLPYFNLTSNKDERNAFASYKGAGTDASHYESEEWGNIEKKFGVDTDEMKSFQFRCRYKTFLFVNRHYNGANAKKAGSAEAWRTTCVKILTELSK